MAKQARPGMGQEEKDKLGAETHAARQRADALDRQAAARGTWTPDDDLDDKTAEELQAEAELRELPVPKSASRDELLKRLRGLSAAVEAHVSARQTETPAVTRQPWEPTP